MNISIRYLYIVTYKTWVIQYQQIYSKLVEATFAEILSNIISFIEE